MTSGHPSRPGAGLGRKVLISPPPEPHADILNRCLSIDCAAMQLYGSFAQEASSEVVGTFWRHMVLEEKEHIEFWRYCLTLAESDLLPRPFEHPEVVIQELAEIQQRIEDLFSLAADKSHPADPFIIAGKMEYYLLHPTFLTFFQLTDALFQRPSIMERYEEHLDGFLTAFQTYGRVESETRMLVELIQDLWRTVRTVVRQSLFDPLTEIFNRRGLFSALMPMAYLAARKKFDVAIMMVDLDFFKALNDLHGHLKGDLVLKKTAEVLKDSIRRSDIVGRYGGDEFLVYLSEIDQGYVLDVAERIRHNIRQELELIVPATATIGLAIGQLGPATEQDLWLRIREADTQLVSAKREGRRDSVNLA